MVPEWLHDYKSVFQNKGFKQLPPKQPWDHMIELIDGAKPWDNTRIIPLSADKREALNEFLDENLKTG